jgi:predicted  nucleic acid-binding Zn-ribbon protein
MDLSNGSGGIDSGKLIDYFTKDFLTDLGKMAVLRDELAKRQGALSAVESASSIRAEADAYAASKKSETDGALADAKETNVAAKELKKSLDARQVELDALSSKLDKDSAALEKAVAAHKKSIEAAEAALLNSQNELKLAQDKLASDQAALEAKVQNFYAKVASLEV